MIGSTNTQHHPYAFLKLQDNNGSNVTYSGAMMPFVELMNTNGNLYLNNGILRFYNPQRIIMWANATFTRSTGEMWMSLKDNTTGKYLATAIDNNGSWGTLNFCTIIDGTIDMQLCMFMHDSSVTLHNSGVSNPLRISNIIIFPL